MNDINTLHALLNAAGLAKSSRRFSKGSLEWTPTILQSPEEVRNELKSASNNGASGWIQFADLNTDVSGSWSSTWEVEHPLEAELVSNDGLQSYRLIHLGASWKWLAATVNPAVEGILETCRHRLLGGGEAYHLVSWNGGTFLRPASVALTCKPNNETPAP